MNNNDRAADSALRAAVSSCGKSAKAAKDAQALCPWFAHLSGRPSFATDVAAAIKAEATAALAAAEATAALAAVKSWREAAEAAVNEKLKRMRA